MNNDVLDLDCSLALLALLFAVGGAYRIRKARQGAARNARVEKDGGSALLGKGTMEGAYWLLTPIARGCVKIGLTANGITTLAVILSALGGIALALGHFGVAAVLTVVSSLGDALDGIVARETHTSSESGEVYDAAADRYEEYFFLAGLGYYFRDANGILALVFLTILGSFMVSYGTAKAEALHIAPPRGSMRRAERAVYLSVGITLVPVAAALLDRFQVVSPYQFLYEHAPILLALAVVGVVSNVSAVLRLQKLGAALRVRSGEAEKAALAAAMEADAPISEPAPSSVVRSTP